MTPTSDPRLDSVSTIKLVDIGSIDLTVGSHAADAAPSCEIDGDIEMSLDGSTMTLKGSRPGPPPQSVAIEGTYVTGNVPIAPMIPGGSPLRIRTMRSGESASVVRLALKPGTTLVIKAADRMLTTTTPDPSSAGTRHAIESVADAIRESAEAFRQRLLGK